MGDVTLWRYYLPNDRPLEGWAEIVIGSNGFFAAVSDFGNYTFRWSSMGVADAREFFLTAERDWDYFARKLGGEHAWEYDGEATCAEVKRRILELRRSKELLAEEARIELALLKKHGDLSDVEGLDAWRGESCLEFRHEVGRRRINLQLEAFCRRTLPRLASVISAELAAEHADVKTVLSSP